VCQLRCPDRVRRENTRGGEAPTKALRRKRPGERSAVGPSPNTCHKMMGSKEPRIRMRAPEADSMEPKHTARVSRVYASPRQK